MKVIIMFLGGNTLVNTGHVNNLQRFPTESSSPEFVFHWLDILCRCPPRQRAWSPVEWRHFNMVPRTKDSLTRFMSKKKSNKTCPSALTFSQGRELGKEEGKIKKQNKWEQPLLWSYRCRSCPPCPHQILSGGKTQCRSSPAPSSPTTQTKVRRWETIAVKAPTKTEIEKWSDQILK